MPIRTEPHRGIQPQLDAAANTVATLLKDRGDVLVTAESCTAGLIAATLARVPGISTNLAGALVVYQIASKVTWLGLSETLIQDHDVVSAEVARAMAEGALAKTPHANVAIGITGHLGPDAPEGLDGVAWLGFADRKNAATVVRLALQTFVPIHTETTGHLETTKHKETTLTPGQRLAIRHDRQQDAVLQALKYLSQKLSAPLV